ncbi:hypothetical protein SCYAM73S_06893 [Streptomyces cyaneofuscatus]
MTPALFGRDHPAGILRSEIVRATESHGGLVLVTGEAGIGKTTLVTDAAHEARRRGTLVVGGSCWDSDSTPGYWPWVQVLRGLRRSATAAEWAAAQDAADGRLGILLGDPGDPAGDGPATGEVDGDGASGASSDGPEAFGLYDAVTTALVTLSQARPLVVVLDDLHSADPASLRLLEFAAQHAWFERLLLIGTYRDVEVEAPGHPLQQLILPLVSRASATLTLTGLGRDEVGALMAVTTGREPEPRLVDEVHRRTGGNPFFVEQTARLWHSGSPVSTIPPGVREAVRQRLSLLPGTVVSLLTAAAVLGREFRRQVLAVVHGSPVPQVERLLESAIVARVVVPLPSGSYAFAHDLLRETLYASLGDADARRRHAAAVRALDAHGGLDDAVLPGDLARHAHLAGAELERDRRVDLLLAAARDASGRLADEEAIGHYRRLAQELAIHIMALARDGSDDEALAFSLWARHDSVWGLGSAVERLGLTDEMAVVGRRTQNLDMELHATSMRWVALLELGDPGFIDQYRTLIRAAERSELPRFALVVAVDGSLIASLQGRFTEAADALNGEELGLEGEDHEAFGFMGCHLHWSLHLLRGRFAEAEKVLAALPGARYPYPGLLEALTAVEQGDAAPALRLIAEQSDRAAPYPRAFMPLWLRLLAQTATTTGDRRLITRAEDELTPYTGQWVVSLYGCDIGGPVDLWLGMLAAARDDRDTAVATLTEAAASADRLGARPWAVRSRLHLARALLARAEPGDTGRARALLGEAEREAGELGLHHLASEGPALRALPPAAGHGPGVPAAAAVPPPAPAAAEFRRDGSVWQLCWGGRTVHVPDAKGLRDLHSLLGLPGTDVPAVHLLAPEGGAVAAAAGRLGGDPVLDEEAKRRYKEHLARLDAEIDRAAARDDTRQVEAYDRERQALLDQLRTAAGLGGRSRRLGDETERARKTVTARIRDTLRKLDALHPELAAHLRESVTTGTTCAYRPGDAPEWRL